MRTFKKMGLLLLPFAFLYFVSSVFTLFPIILPHLCSPFPERLVAPHCLQDWVWALLEPSAEHGFRESLSWCSFIKPVFPGNLRIGIFPPSQFAFFCLEPTKDYGPLLVTSMPSRLQWT